ncbi:copper transporter 4 [Ricinus communis]|uniref:Copper transport protein n=1 Tax=Ricinus communis TaxID=3988 RepID=B9T7G3_RICCO|nr:copper transporter 4 [Ricinus communis]EEF28206.1 copper transporter, putative [Ricinus communis]|eukprot:XP_025015722.1 copper transporter 4 [Ricinus communis]
MASGDTMMPHHGGSVSSLTSACTTGSSTSTSSIHVHRKALTHMTFFWGHTTEVLFKGWPGSSSGMYALALIFVFVLAVVVEWFNYCSIIKPGTNKVAAGFFRTGMHAVRTGLSYMVMLAVMSFNGGIFLAAVGGHAVGFSLFGSKVFNKSEKKPDLPPINLKC